MTWDSLSFLYNWILTLNLSSSILDNNNNVKIINFEEHAEAELCHVQHSSLCLFPPKGRCHKDPQGWRQNICDRWVPDTTQMWQKLPYLAQKCKFWVQNQDFDKLTAFANCLVSYISLFLHKHLRLKDNFVLKLTQTCFCW